jgi:hypothetical protein
MKILSIYFLIKPKYNFIKNKYNQIFYQLITILHNLSLFIRQSEVKE